MTEDAHPREAGGLLQTGTLAGMLARGGTLSARLDGFEERPGQLQMLEAVCRAFNGDGILAVEAGTGVGKSLAYGLPAAAWAQNSGEKVVISSATINLQEQLVGKDLPVVSESLGRELRVVLVKGRGNYLCRRRLSGLVSQGTFPGMDEGRQYLDELSRWAELTSDGSRADLPFGVPEYVWESVASDADACLGHRCPFRKECFFAHARQEAENADLLVVNHHLLFADLALRRALDDWSRRAVLPSFTRLILDEAHGLEDAASSFFGVRLTRFGVGRILSRLSPAKSSRGGLLHGLSAEISSSRDTLAASRADRLRGEAHGPVASLVADVKQKYEQGFGFLRSLAVDLRPAGADPRVRLTTEVFGHQDWTAVRETFMQAAAGARELTAEVEKLIEHLAVGQGEDGKLAEVRAWIGRVGALSRETEHLVSERADESVRWLEVARKREKRVALQSAPLDVSRLMYETVYQQMSSVVLTSATLSVGGNFDFLASRIGLDLEPEERVCTLLVQSPFDFTRQVRLALPGGLPDPNQAMFEQLLPEVVYQMVSVSGGGALVLFTAWGLMTRVFDLVRDRLESLGIEPMCQGEQPRDRLLGRLRENEGSVLFGTHSFWQGVDVVGDALRCVIITRLPFDVPDEPLVQARMEVVEKEGKSSFAHFMLPRAVLKLKQGFGRLIRRRSDWGAVVVLDNRMLSRSYGRRFLGSLPSATVLTGSVEEICDELAEFFFDRGGISTERVIQENQ